MIASRVARLLAVSVLAALSALGSPSAQAVSPPQIDDKWLPKPALPAPPWPTVQREVCATMTAAPQPARSQLVGLDDLPRVWQLTRGAGQRIAVIDTGVSRQPRLPDVVAGGDYVAGGDGTQDCDAHGTLVAAIIAATPDSAGGGLGGVAPDATLISIRQSSAKFAPASERSRAGVGDVDTMAKAIRTAADLGASVINISSVACVPVASAPDDRALGAALAYAVDVKNAVIVAAAGNTGEAAQCPPQRSDATWQTVTVVASPAWYDDYVLAVGSVNADGTPSAFTLAGPWVDVAATGEAVTPLGSQPVSGTSYAAPVVSGLAALIRARFPALTARQVMQRIESTAHHPPAGSDPLVGNGTIDALAAVSTDAGPTPDTSKPAPPPAPIATPPAPRPPHSGARATAVRGAALCLLALMGVLAAGAATGRLRSRNRVAGG
nr:type VII secretion-associated serine protease mycosin [Mycobacterium sp. 852002-51057_SCH5723018]